MGKLDGKWGSSTRPGANGNDGIQPNEDVIFHHNFPKPLGISELSKQSEDRTNAMGWTEIGKTNQTDPNSI